jgi:polysaccharide transporter, PST family
MIQRWTQFLPPFLHQRLHRLMQQKVVSNTGWLFADKILRAAGELTVGLWAARYLGPENFGTLNYAIAFVGIFSAFSTLGLNRIVVRDVLQQPERSEETLGTAFILCLASGGAVTLAAIGLILNLRPADTTLHWLVALMAAGLLFQASDVITFLFNSRIEAKHDIKARSFAYALTNFVRIGCILSGASLVILGSTYLLEPAVRFVGLILSYQQQHGSLRAWRFRFSRAKSLLQQSWPLILSGLAVTIYMRIDQIMLGQLASSEAVGIYSAAVRLSESWYFIPVAISTSMFPKILAYKSENQATYHAQLKKLFKLVIAITYLIIVATTLFAKPVITNILGSSYSASATVLSVHIWAGLFVSLGVIRELWLTAENLLNISFFTTASGAVLNVVLNCLLIPGYGAMGATVATIASYAIAAFLSGFLLKRTRVIAVIMAKSLIFN